jgi:hypothetical protein
VTEFIRCDPDAGPYEIALRHLVDQARRHMQLSEEAYVVVGVPPWLAARVAAETGEPLRPRPAGSCLVDLGVVRVIGSAQLDGPGAGAVVVIDLVGGRSYDSPAGCHPDLVPHRWSHYALALAHGLNPNAALDVAGLLA